MTRPLLQETIVELRERAARNNESLSELDLLRDELVHRKTEAARTLRSSVEQRIAILKTKNRRSVVPVKPAPQKQMGNRVEQISNETRVWTNKAVAALRAKLIDLSRRSPLISFKHGERSASQLRIVDERPDLLFATLIEGEMGFEPLPGEETTPADEKSPDFQIAYERARLIDEQFAAATAGLGEDEDDARAWQDAERALRGRVREQLGLPKIEYGVRIDVKSVARAYGFDPSYELRASDDDDVQDHHKDSEIRVLLTRKELDKRLKTIWDRARTHERETGLHTLHLVFGFVQWFEDDASSIPMQAPLLLLPVAVSRQARRGRYEYQLSSIDEGLEVNVALREKARSEWGIELPELRVDETPESYFVRIITILEQGRRLSLRRFATIAVLPPMVLWRDLDLESWPEDAFAAHNLLPGLVGTAPMANDAGMAETIEIDHPDWEAILPALVCDADASQHSAIIDMAAGHHLAIEGPPGTGKSQTITNMIATALANGKRVLFVAEKQAALRVVADRLRVAGFGPLLLELHGGKANRAEVYDGIRHRLAQVERVDESVLVQKRSELKRHRQMLRRYLGLIDNKLGKLDHSAHALVWKEISLRKHFDAELVQLMAGRWRPSDPTNLTRQQLTEDREKLQQYGTAVSTLTQEGREATRTKWIHAARLDAFDQSYILVLAAEVAQTARKLAETEAPLAASGLAMPKPSEDNSSFVQFLNALEPFSISDEAIINSALHYFDQAKDLIRCQNHWDSLSNELSQVVAEPDDVSEERIEELNAALNLEFLPGTFEEVLKRRDDAEALVSSRKQAAIDTSRFTDVMAHDDTLDVSHIAEILQVFGQIDELSANQAILLSEKLLDPLAETLLIASAAEADQLMEERASLSGEFLDEAFTTEPSDLDALADILEDTGIVGRVLGGEYRAAKRRVRRLIADFGKRDSTAIELRRLAMFKRNQSAFHDSNKSRHFFPPLAWNGIESDFAAAIAARRVMANSRQLLGKYDEASMLQTWLASEASSRDEFLQLARRLSLFVNEAIGAGFGGITFSELKAELPSRLEQLNRLTKSLSAIGAKQHCPLKMKSGDTLAFALTRLSSAKADFAALSSQNHFEWVGNIEQPLTDLSSCLKDLVQLSENGEEYGLKELMAGQQRPGEWLSGICSHRSNWSEAKLQYESACAALADECAIDIEVIIEDSDWTGVSATFQSMSEDKGGISLAAEVLKYRKLVDAAGLSPIADAVLAGEVSTSHADDLFELLSIRNLLRHYLGGDGLELQNLGSLTLDQARSAFRSVDAELHKLEAKAILANRLKDKAPKGHGYGPKTSYTDLSLLSHEIELKRPRTPMRDVVHRAGNALLALKPVWMMSPTSAAQYIRPGSINFDLLVVDEASQLRPEFAISSVMRASQFVVVGDANQLPPSDHFQMATTDKDECDEEDDVGVDENTESILDLANQKFHRKRRLKWHYRSQHESLIQFSNRNFYERDLVVFPSPMGNDDELLGVKCTYVPDVYKDTVYEASINQREAERVIEEAFGLMRTYPERSLGIAAMNAKQTELIKNEFDRLVLEEPEVAKYVEAFRGSIDEFFIKNLENVQGDERDIILISTVYGPDKNGKVRQNFGLMNREVGWRRLNVLVTRAKLSCRLITSLRPDDIKITENSSRGVTSFKAYLTYAHHGAQYDDASGGETDSDFEIFVADALRGAGYEVIYQVGVEGFRIDLGVKHASCPVGFIAGIECDGAPYHTGLSVRDRDRIRQSILEGLGWNIYRVWSTDWFADPSRETAKLLAWLDVKREHALRTGTRQKNEDTHVAASPNHPLHAETALEEVEKVPPVEPPSDQISNLSARLPDGEKMRNIGDFDWYSAVRGQLYEVWINGRLLGEVEVIKRATQAPKLYDGRAVTPQSEYEGRIEESGDAFRSFDLYAAVREVAKRALTIGNF